MNIQAFKAALGNGGSRPNQFLVTLNWPAIVGSPGGDYNFLIESASLPESSVEPTIVQYRGREVKFAGERSFAPWNISVANDTDLKVRSYLEAWSSTMNDYIDNSGVTAPNAYMVDLIVQQLDRNNEVGRTYTLRGAFPIEVSAIALSYSANNVVSSTAVTFIYQDFVVALP